MANSSSYSNFQFVVTTTPGVPPDSTTKLTIRKKAMKAAAVTRKANGASGNTNRLQYPPDVYPCLSNATRPTDKHGNNSVCRRGNPSCKTIVLARQFQEKDSLEPSSQACSSLLHRDPRRFKRDLMAKIAAAQSIPARISQQGFELTRMKYGVDPINLSALTTLHVGRTKLAPFGVKASQLMKILPLQQHSYLSFIPERYNEAQCLNDAADCLFAATRQLYADQNNVESWALTTASFYGRALKSLHRAINNDSSRLAPETLCATQMMAMIELLNASSDDIRFLHIDAASRLIEQRGPQGFHSDFEKALLNAHARNSVRVLLLPRQYDIDKKKIINSLLTGRACFLENEDWQRALFETVDMKIGAVDRSERVVSLWLCHAKLPGLFCEVDRLLNEDFRRHAYEKQSAIRRINTFLRDLWTWRSKWSSQFETYQLESLVVPQPTKECDKRRDAMCMFYSCLIFANRLYITLDGRGGAVLEQQAQDAACRILDLQAQAHQFSPQGDFFMTQAIGIARCTLATADGWKQAFEQNEEITGQEPIINAALFREWSTMLGRKGRVGESS